MADVLNLILNLLWFGAFVRLLYYWRKLKNLEKRQAALVLRIRQLKAEGYTPLPVPGARQPGVVPRAEGNTPLPVPGAPQAVVLPREEI